MKKVMIVACILAHAYVGAGEEKKGKAQIEAEPRQKRLEEFLAEYGDVAQRVGEFVPSWKLLSIISAPLSYSMALPYRSVFLSHDGHLLAAFAPDSVAVFTTSPVKRLKKIPLEDVGPLWYGQCIFNKVGTMMVINGSTHIHIIPIMDEVKPISVAKRASFIAFNPKNDTEIFCASETHPLEVLDMKGEVKDTFDEGSQSYDGFCFSPDGKYIVLQGTKEIWPSAWDISLKKRIFEMVLDSYTVRPGAYLLYSHKGSKILFADPPYGQGRRVYIAGLFNAKNGEKISVKAFDLL